MNLFTKLAFSSVLALGVFSCAKPGCTDPIATNFSESAKKNDGSCTYQTKLILWQNLTNATSWAQYDVTILKYYIDGAYVGSSSATEYFTGQPSCAQDGQAYKVIDLGQNSSSSVHIEIKDQDDVVWYDDYMTVTNAECNYYQFN
jgi:hypothetical protein